MQEEVDYWESFYKSHRVNNKPSPFAVEMAAKYMKPDRNVLELGCGNGRDSFYFAEKGLNVTGLDLAQSEMEFLNSLKKKRTGFLHQDFTDLTLFSGYEYVYSRFSFHAIVEAREDQILKQLPNVLNKEGLFMLEARSSKDKSLEKEFGTDHYRRYLDVQKTVTKIQATGLQIIDQCECRGVAVYKQEDPWIIRIIAKNS